MRLLIVFTFFISNYSFSQTEIVDSNYIIAFNEQIAQAIIDGDRNLEVGDYLTKDELKIFMDGVPDSLNPDSLLQIELDEYDVNLNQFSEYYSSNFKLLNLSLSRSEEINWVDCTVDSSGYMFVIHNSVGRDKKIRWPESKNYELGNDLFVVCKGVVFISEGEKKYGIEVGTVYCDGKLKFYYWVRAPRILRLE